MQNVQVFYATPINLIITFCQDGECCSTEPVETAEDCRSIKLYQNDFLGDCNEYQFKVHEPITGMF